MEFNSGLFKQLHDSYETSDDKLCILDEDKKMIGDYQQKIQDLNSQLEYEIEQHKAELTERDNKIRKLEKQIEEIEKTQNDGAERDEAVFQMSEKLLVLSNNYDELLKEHKLKEEELNLLRNKKKYKNDKTNQLIINLKNEIENKKHEYEQLNEKYVQLLKDISTLKKENSFLKLEKVNKEAMLINSEYEQKVQEQDEENARKILSLRNGINTNPNFKNNDNDELSNLKMELTYKDMIIQKLLKSKIAQGQSVSNENNYAEQIRANEKKIEDMYNKYLNSQSDADKCRKEIAKLKNEIKYLKEENELLLNNFNDLKKINSTTPKNQRRISEFGDFLNNVMKENSILNEKISTQRIENMKDMYYYNKEIEMIKDDKLKIIEKLDHKKIVHPPHLYEPIYVTLNVKEDISLENTESENFPKIIQCKSNDSEESNLKQSTKNPIVTDKLVHAYITDYMENVFNKK